MVAPRSIHAAVMSCGPGVSRTLTRDRSSTWSPIAVLFSEVRGPVLGAADLEQVDALAVHRVLHQVLVLEAAHHAEIGAEELRRQRVVALDLNHRPGQQPADGAERQTFDVPILRRVLAQVEHLRAGTDVGAADRQRRHLAGGADVLLHQRGRDAEHVGDVVEAVGGIVGRQQRGRVHLEIEQIANRVGVFGAIQPVERRTSGIGLGGRRAIERGRELTRRTRRASVGSGCRTPSGGIIPVRTLRMAFSHTSASAGTFAGSRLVSTEPAGLGALVVAGGAVLLHHRPDDGRGRRPVERTERRVGRGAGAGASAARRRAGQSCLPSQPRPGHRQNTPGEGSETCHRAPNHLCTCIGSQPRPN